MAEETIEKPEEPEISVEVAPDNDLPGKPELSDEEVAKLEDFPGDDEIKHYAKDAQRRIKNYRIANQEIRRRAAQSSKDVATATTLAEQLYRENQELKASVGRSETALIDQALQRTEAQLAQAKQRAKIAIANQNPDEIVAAHEEVARYVAEAGRLRLLQTPPPAGRDAREPVPPPQPAPAPPQQQEMTPHMREWLARNPWWEKPGSEDISGFALGVHKSLVAQGITDINNPKEYFGTIDRRLRDKFPERFEAVKEATKEAVTRPANVTGAIRTNGAPEPPTRRGRHVVLSESQVRIARSLGLTNEQYAAQLIKEEAAKEGKA